MKNSSQPAFASINEVLWWLPEDTESIAAIQGGLPANSNLDAVNSSYGGIASIILGEFRKGKLAEQLFKIPILRIVSGSRKFRNTRGFGLMPYEGCSIIDFQSDLPEDHALSQWLAKNAARTEIVAGYKTFIFDEKLEQDQWHFLIVQPRPNLLLFATNKSYLESVLRRRDRSTYEREKTVRALPATLPEWKYVDTKSPDWAVRHFRKDQARFDPTSPLARKNWVPFDTDAMGITYSLNTKQNVAAVHYLTSPRNTASMAKEYKQFWGSLSGFMNVPENVKWQPVIALHSNTVIEMKFSVSESTVTNTNAAFQFGLMALMGHAIVV